MVNFGGSSPELGFDGCDTGAFEDGAPPAGAADLFAFGSRVNRGGPSSAALIPAGAASAFFAVSGASVPIGRHMPVPSHGIAAFGLLLCSALPTVNSPSELPERSPSYTTPESNAIGTGSALYALASQNFPLIKIATGMIDALPFFPNWTIPSARGPESFLRGAFRSPGMICGRASCAIASGAMDAARARISAMPTTRDRILKCKILNNACGRQVQTLAHFRFGGEFRMKVNDKAPDFTLQDENGAEVALKDLRGKTVVLFFYPRANTPG